MTRLVLFVSGVFMLQAWTCQTVTRLLPETLNESKNVKQAPKARTPETVSAIRLAKARKFAREKNFDTSYCLLVNMGIPSGTNRFFLYHFGKDTILIQGLVTHGQGGSDFYAPPVFSNGVGSYCTSLGRYRVGQKYYGQFGLAYKLYGLDKTNSNAYVRAVVLHAHECVPETESGELICRSQGCPTVAPGFLKQLEPLLDAAKKPLLLWIYKE